jgi:hypothetical protein
MGPTCLAQPPKLLLEDESGIYRHALDSVIKVIEKEKPLRMLYVDARQCVSNYLPDTIDNVAVVTDRKKVERKKRKLKDDELVLSVACGQIIDDQAVVILATPELSKWVFAYHYDFSSNRKVPKLLFVNRGIDR